MSVAEQQVAELELHGYLDGELGKARLDIVENYLDQNRTAAERLVHYGIQGDLIRRLYGPLTNRPMPNSIADRLQVVAKPKAKSGRKMLTVSVLLLAVLMLAATAWFIQPLIIGQIPTMDGLRSFFAE